MTMSSWYYLRPLESQVHVKTDEPGVQDDQTPYL